MSETTAPPVVDDGAIPAAVAPIIETPAPDPIAAPVAETPVVAEPAAPAFTPHTDVPSLLDEISKSAEPEKPAEPDKPTEPPKPPEAEAPAAPKYEFKWPETIKAPPERVAELETVLGGANVPPDVAQKLVDMHAAELTKFATETLANQHRTFADTRQGWRDLIKADPMLGGAGFQTVARDVAQARDLLVPESDRKEFNEWQAATGSGDHPAFWRLLYRVSRMLKEPTMRAAEAPPPNIGQRPRGARVADMYDHPSSQATNR